MQGSPLAKFTPGNISKDLGPFPYQSAIRKSRKWYLNEDKIKVFDWEQKLRISVPTASILSYLWKPFIIGSYILS